MPDILRQNLEVVRPVPIGSLGPGEYFWVSAELCGKKPSTLENKIGIEDCPIPPGAYRLLGFCVFCGFGSCWYKVLGNAGKDGGSHVTTVVGHNGEHKAFVTGQMGPDGVVRHTTTAV